VAVTQAGFLTANSYFDGRRPGAVQAALDEAALHFDATVCGPLYDALVEAQARVILLSDPNGLPTSTTGDKSGLADSAAERLKALKRLVPIRGLGIRRVPEWPGEVPE
jgi:hypothetical protein